MKWIYWVCLVILAIGKELVFNQLTIKQTQNNYWIRYKIDILFNQLDFINRQQVPLAKSILLIAFACIGVFISYRLSQIYKTSKLYLYTVGSIIIVASISGTIYFFSHAISLKLLAINLVGLTYTPLPIFVTLLLQKFSANQNTA